MASNKNKITIKPMNNAAAIASTLGINTPLAPPTRNEIEQIENEKIFLESTNDKTHDNGIHNLEPDQVPRAKSKNVKRVDKASENREKLARKQEREATNSEKFEDKAINKVANSSFEITELPLLIEIKRRFPGKELFVLSLLYLQRNKKGLVQTTVNSMMTLYGTVFEDVIKDDTVRRSLKRLFDAGFIKTTSIPGNNSGYVYAIGDLIESNELSETEKEEFEELTMFVKSKLDL